MSIQEEEIEERIQKQSELLAKLLGGAVHYLLEEDGTFSIPYVSNDYLKLTHRSREEMQSLTQDVIYQYVHPEDLTCLQQTVEESLQKKEGQFCVAYRIKLGDSDEYIWLQNVTSFYKRDKQYFFYANYLDITGQVVVGLKGEKEAEKRFEEARRTHEESQRENLRNALAQAEAASRAKSDFLSRMSHEIRTPMNAIIGMSTLAAQCVNDPKQVADCISKVGLSARFLLSLINDILDMSRIESGKMVVRQEKFPFEELLNGINGIIYEQAVKKGLDYDCVLTSFTNQYYIGDAMKIQQVLVNLLGNAIKFTPAGGKIQLIIHQGKVDKDVAYMTFTVNDTGVGISEAFQKKMFDPFEQGNTSTQTPYGGTGLGLAICKNLVSMMDGKISVNSIEGVGSEFTVELKLGICEDVVVSNRLKQEVNLSCLHTLVVDDDIVICEHTRNILQDIGMQAEWVDSGRHAVELVTERWKRKKIFDIILIDWKMPDMDGIETTKQIREIVGPDVTIIIMTAYDWTEIESDARAAGVNMFMTKPLFKSSITSAFEQVYLQKKTEQKTEVEINYDFTGMRVLLVEDHILNVEVAKRLLESKGVCVEVAENGLAAIESFTMAGEDYFDLILMDIRMPMMDGLTAAKSIRHLKKAYAKTVPIVAMSANAFDEDVEKSKAAGMNAHLAKPIEPAVLFATLYNYWQKNEQ